MEPGCLNKGFVVGGDARVERLLPWWWWNYAKTNSWPVTFFDFGLSEEMRGWCKRRGEVLELRECAPVAPKESVSEERVEAWEKKYGSGFWESRTGWFKKPAACLLSPYETSVWMDLDCEVRGDLSSLFTLPLPEEGVAVTKEYVGGEEIGINSGVVVFRRGALLVKEWARESLENSDLHPGDQDALYSVTLQKKMPVFELPVIYNKSRFSSDLSDALVVHRHGEVGKRYIFEQIENTQDLLHIFEQAVSRGNGGL